MFSNAGRGPKGSPSQPPSPNPPVAWPAKMQRRTLSKADGEGSRYDVRGFACVSSCHYKVKEKPLEKSDVHN